ncbi:UNVERIFIED_CONTAM: hypothetical protein Sradi_1320600 [Sesamum radiatum]|uniref:Integrase zinc-binding domain-containing protein n=1 Tax=Sesamum radiatum TaxID=300843 RepID=A0AAW2USR9_SESRA
MISGIKGRKDAVIIKETTTIEEENINIVQIEELWRLPLIQFLKEGTLPSDLGATKRLTFKANRFMMEGKELYKRTPEALLLKCLTKMQARYVLTEIHEGSCGNHSCGRTLAQKVFRQGYFWPTMVEDENELSKKCQSCQKFATTSHVPATPMEPD